MTDQKRVDDDLEALGLALRRLPTPRPTDELVSRVRRLAHLRLAEPAEERLDRPVIVFLLLFSWTVSIFTLLVVRLLGAVSFGLPGGLAGWTFSWSVAYFAYAWVVGTAVLVLLGIHMRKERRLA